MVASSEARDVLLWCCRALQSSLELQTAALTYSISANLLQTSISVLCPNPPTRFHSAAHFHDLQRWRVSIKHEHDCINWKVAWGTTQKWNSATMCLGPSFGSTGEQNGVWDERGTLGSCPPLLTLPSGLPKALGLVDIWRILRVIAWLRITCPRYLGKRKIPSITHCFVRLVTVKEVAFRGVTQLCRDKSSTGEQGKQRARHLATGWQSQSAQAVWLPLLLVGIKKNSSSFASASPQQFLTWAHGANMEHFPLFMELGCLFK